MNVIKFLELQHYLKPTPSIVAIPKLTTSSFSDVVLLEHMTFM